MANRSPDIDQVQQDALWGIMQHALQHHGEGRLPQAESLYRQILQRDPNHVDALHMLGVLAGQVKHHDIAVSLIRQAIALQPNFPEAYINLGHVLWEAGKLDESIAARTARPSRWIPNTLKRIAGSGRCSCG